MKKRLILMILLSISFSIFSQNGAMITKETPEQKNQRMSWWTEARFGMFIHWGLYAIPAGVWNGKKYYGASEWLQDRAGIDPLEYQQLASQWNPQSYDPKRWVEIAKNAGMKYIVITSRHHEGFSLWPTAYSDFSVKNTPYGKDLLKPLAEECKKQGIKLCFYYTIMDWHHADYLPRHYYDKRPTSNADFNRFVQFLKNQLTELVVNYDPALLWFDGEWESTWNHSYAEELFIHLKTLKPSLIINNRIDVGRQGMAGLTKEGDFYGDYGTPEQEIPKGGFKGVYWESCMTMNGSWGYSTIDTKWKSAQQLIYNLVDCASKGGNYLLNVGPTSAGVIPPESVDRLAEMGHWLSENGESIYGSSPYFSDLPVNARITEKGKTYFVIPFKNKNNTVLFNLKKGESVKTVSSLGKTAIPVSFSVDGCSVTLKFPKGTDYKKMAVITVEVQ